jgi:cytochrome c551/c552
MSWRFNSRRKLAPAMKVIGTRTARPRVEVIRFMNANIAKQPSRGLREFPFVRAVASCQLALLVAPFISLGAELLTIELPPETRTFRPGPAFEIANAQCLICHSEDYVAIQPPLARTFWKNNVQKMQQKYGAPIPEDQVEPLVDYLAKAYGADSGVKSQGSVPNQKAGLKDEPLSKVPDSASPDLESVQLAAKFGCTSCHGVDKKIVGPPLKEIAAKYKGHADAFEKVSHQITQGGGGQWGPVPMPPFPQLSAAEVKALSQWILNRP